MTQDELDQIRTEHQAIPCDCTGSPHPMCQSCYEHWPCDVETALTGRSNWELINIIERHKPERPPHSTENLMYCEKCQGEWPCDPWRAAVTVLLDNNAR